MGANKSAKTCADMRQYCKELPAYPRAYCPQTCGCENPLHGLFFWDTGCPTLSCIQKSPRRKKILDGLECNDFGIDHLLRTPGWDRLLSDYKVYLVRDWYIRIEKADLMISSLKTQGCLAISNQTSNLAKAWKRIITKFLAVNGTRVWTVMSDVMCGPFATFCPDACRCAQ